MLIINTLVVLAITTGVVIAFFEDGQTAPSGCDA
jgi:hypothetical protein